MNKVEQSGTHCVIYDETESKSVCLAKGLLEEGCSLDPPVGHISLLKRAVIKLAQYYVPNNVKSIPDKPRCVLIASGGNLGGAILSLPLVEAVRERFPEAHLAVVSNTKVGKEFMEVANIGDSFYTIAPDSRRNMRKFVNYIFTIAKIARKRPQIYISNHDSYIDQFIIPLRIRWRIGHSGRFRLNSPISSIVWKSLFNHRVPIDSNMNWLETYRLLGKAIGAGFLEPPSVTVSGRLKAWAKQELTQLGLNKGERCIAVQIGVWEVQPWKQWPVSKVAELCLRLWREHRLRPILVGNASGISFLRKIQAMNINLPFISLVDSTSVAQATAIISQCTASICNDSGLMHLSAAIGTPTVAIYGMTDPKETWCYERPHCIVRRKDCMPCYSLDKRILESCQHKKCLTELSPDVVYQVIAKSLIKLQQNVTLTK